MTRNVIKKYATELALEIGNVSEGVNLSRLRVNEINTKKYEKFLEDYLKKPDTSEERFAVQLMGLVKTVVEKESRQ